MNKNQEKLDALRHSASHLLAAAVLKHYPNAKHTLGPSIENGFYYDFDFGPDVSISKDDLKNIQKTMKKMVNKWSGFDREEVSPQKAKEVYADNPYKTEMIEELEKEGETISLYKSGDFVDLCRGGHVDEPNKDLKYFKLLSVAGAYWRGDEKNKMLTRIYGTAFFSKEELDKHLKMLEEAKKRDHRKIGRDQDLFYIDEAVGKGLAMWLPKGQIIKEEIEELAKQKEEEAGYFRVTTPHIAKEELYLTSGHLPYYKDDMFPPMEADDGTYYLKAMNCPHHHRIYLHKPKSYRDLPLRLAEYGMCYRNELSGTLAGLLRVRGLDMNDAHIYCTKDQIKDEFKAVMTMVQDYFNLFGFDDYWFRLSKWDPNRTEKYINEPENWEYSEQVIREVLQEMKVDFVEADDEAAFYGPKVDVQFKSAVGREESMSTIQLDFMAKEKFSLSYTDKDGSDNNQVFVIHRAPLSVHERFIAFLIEHFAGAFPTWLSPIQAVVMPISDSHLEYSKEIEDALKKVNVRVELWDESNSLQKRIRTAEKQKIPFMLIIGDKEVESDSVSVRSRGQVDLGSINKQELIDKIINNIESKSLKIK